MKKIIFFTTEGCHLCDQAEQILLSLQGFVAYECEVIDISESNELINQYGTRIPVLKKNDDDDEMDWPFSHQQILQWLT